MTLDSSVIIASLREQENKHNECKNLMELVEVVSAIVIHVAKRNSSSLVTLDKEMEMLAKKVCKIKSIVDF